jgi:hypothetical protein
MAVWSGPDADAGEAAAHAMFDTALAAMRSGACHVSPATLAQRVAVLSCSGRA